VSAERCGCWIETGGDDAVCMRSLNHEGPCLPYRHELMKQIEHLEAKVERLSKFVTITDNTNWALWPNRKRRS
jgi:hypothetical protein